MTTLLAAMMAAFLSEAANVNVTVADMLYACAQADAERGCGLNRFHRAAAGAHQKTIAIDAMRCCVALVQASSPCCHISPTQCH